MNLILVRGIPGSGKSTLARKLATDDTVHLEADQYFIDQYGDYKFDPTWLGSAHQWCQLTTEKNLVAGNDVICSNTFTTIKEMRPYFEIALKFGFIPTVILCQNTFQNVHSVPDEALDRMKARFVYDIQPLMQEYTAKLAELATE